MVNRNERKGWHGAIDRALLTATSSGKPVIVERLLDRVGIFTWAPYRAEALTYATAMLANYQTKGRHDDR
jgi:hypothetical protein